MKRFFSFLIASIFILFVVSCGKKGPIFPPLVKFPQKIEQLELVQRGDYIILEWTHPTSYEDGSPLPEVIEIEVWLYQEERKSDEEGESVGEEEFEEKAELIASIKKEAFPWYQTGEKEESLEFCYFFRLIDKDIFSKNLTFRLRLKDRKKRKLAFSDLFSMEPRILPLPPQKIQLNLFNDKIEVKWDAPDRNINQTWPPIILGYNIYRSEGEELPQRLNSELIKERKYDDKDFLFGEEYHYFVRASATKEAPFSESGDSEVVKVTPKDTFAPAAPSGLVSVAGEDFISITWDENPEEDLAGYSVWRRAEEDDDYVVLTAQPIRENAYTDTAVEKNRRYYYAITARDVNGNESQKSNIISEIVRDEVT